ncbi:MAG: hypothetical protein AAF772_18540, partial [Acidobacteriota bacterium]
MTTRRAARASSARRNDADAGYTLVVLAMLITVMNIVLATTLPMWSAIQQREREAELIFRGLQYA